MHWKNTKTQWGWVMIVNHWVSFIIIVGLFSLGLWMVDLTYYDTWYHKAPNLHKSVGIIFLGLLVFRSFWRVYDEIPEPLSSHSSWEQLVAKWVHRIFYFLIYAVIFSGYFISTAKGQGINVFDWFEIPALFSGVEGQEDLAGKIHFWLAIGLLVLIVVHASASIKHHFIDRDKTLLRMLGKE